MNLRMPLGMAAILTCVALAGCVEPSAAAPATIDGPRDEPAAAPELVFSWTPAQPAPKEPAAFTATVTPASAGTDIHWDFGDGTSSTATSPRHEFRTAGTYTVQATLKGDGWTTQASNIVRVAEVTAEPTAPPPEPTVEVAPPTIAVTLDANVAAFQASWSETATAYSWSFGDGATSSEANPSHRYTATGTYTVTLALASPAADGSATMDVEITEVPHAPRVVVGVTDSGINPYHEVYYRPHATEHPCTYVAGYNDCSIKALDLSVGPGLGSYQDRLAADSGEWATVEPGNWYWIPQTAFIGVRCPAGGSSQGGTCILDDQSTHGTGTTSSVLTEAPEALLVFNDGSSSPQLATAPVPIDIESNSWGSLAPLYAGYVNGPTGTQLCHDDVDADTSVKFRSAGNNGPVPNMGDCWRNGHRAYSVAGGYPDGSHDEFSGSAPDFASYMCRPVAATGTTYAWRNACGTSFAAPTAAGTAAAALLSIRQELDYSGAATTTELAPGLTHEAFIDATIMAATYEPESRPGYPSAGLNSVAASQTQWYWWGWGWLDVQVAERMVDCAMGRSCPDEKSSNAWTFNEYRRSFASDGDP